ncbi:MAG: metal-sensitive transcriptional regulator [Anaerolineae bacterium]|nr:metal-sensitive transcriptional regulator [Anaerolineae bacterium]
MKIENPNAKKELVNRLKRIEGQVRGVQAMLDDQRDCREILQQLSAIRSALQSVTLGLIEQYTLECLLNSREENPIQRQELVKDLIQLIGKAP